MTTIRVENKQYSSIEGNQECFSREIIARGWCTLEELLSPTKECATMSPAANICTDSTNPDEADMAKALKRVIHGGEKKVSYMTGLFGSSHVVCSPEVKDTDIECILARVGNYHYISPHPETDRRIALYDELVSARKAASDLSLTGNKYVVESRPVGSLLNCYDYWVVRQ